MHLLKLISLGVLLATSSGTILSCVQREPEVEKPMKRYHPITKPEVDATLPSLFDQAELDGQDSIQFAKLVSMMQADTAQESIQGFFSCKMNGKDYFGRTFFIKSSEEQNLHMHTEWRGYDLGYFSVTGFRKEQFERLGAYSLNKNIPFFSLIKDCDFYEAYKVDSLKKNEIYFETVALDGTTKVLAAKFNLFLQYDSIETRIEKGYMSLNPPAKLSVTQGYLISVEMLSETNRISKLIGLPQCRRCTVK